MSDDTDDKSRGDEGDENGKDCHDEEDVTPCHDIGDGPKDGSTSIVSMMTVMKMMMIAWWEYARPRRSLQTEAR